MSKYWWIGDPFMKQKFEKTHNAEKNRKGSLGFFNIPSVGKYQKNEGDRSVKIFFRNKVSQSQK